MCEAPFLQMGFPDGSASKESTGKARDTADMGSIPGRGTKIPHALQPRIQNMKQKRYYNKFNKDFKNGSHQRQKNLKKNFF